MIGERIKAARKRLALSQGELAQRVGVAQPTVSQYERGIAAPSTDTLAMLAQVLRVGFEWLATGRGDMERSYPPPELGLVAQEPPPPDEQELLALYRRLPSSRRQALLDFIRKWQ